MEIIDRQLQDEGIGMKAVPAEYDHRKERKVVEEIQKAAERAEEVLQVEPVASKQIESFAQNAAVNTIRKNAQAQSNAGIEALVTRRYDGVGVHMRKDPCEWCLERCGENMPYSEAYSKGAFERHPGCHCEIFYKPKRGGWQRQSNWKYNEWEDAQDHDIIDMRRNYGKTLIKPRFRTGAMTPEDYAAASRMWKTVKELNLPQREKEWVYKEFDDNLTAEEKVSPIVCRPIGDYYYHAVNKGHNQYKIYKKDPIDPYTDWMDEIMSEVFGRNWRNFDS